MASADNILELLIKLNYVGAENADKARDAIAAIKAETNDLSTSLPEGSELWSKYKNVLGESGEAASKFNEHGREMRKVIGMLDREVPGLGEGFKALVEGAGPLTVLVLGIEAAVTWWHFYKEAAEAAAQANAEAMDKFRSATRAAMEQQWEFNEAVKDALNTADPYSTALGRQNQIIDAQTAAKKKLLQVEEALALAQAGDDKVKQAQVKAQFEGAMSALDQDAGAKKVALIDNVVAAISGKLKLDNADLAKMQDQFKEAVTAHDSNKVLRLTAQMQKLEQDVVKLTKERTAFQDQAATEADVNAAKTRGERGTEFFKSLMDAEALSNRARGGEKLGGDQQQFILRLAQVASGQALNLQQAEAYLQSLERTPQALGAVLARLVGYNDTIFNIIQQSANKLEQHDARLAQLQAQIDRK